MPALHTMELSWGSEKRKKQAKAYAKKKRTTISKIVQEHFDELFKEDRLTKDLPF